MSDLEGTREQMDIVVSEGLGSSGGSVCMCVCARACVDRQGAASSIAVLLSLSPPLCLLTPFLDHSAPC